MLSTDAILAFYQTNLNEATEYFSDFIIKKRLALLITGIICFVFLSYKLTFNINLPSLKTEKIQCSFIVMSLLIGVFSIYRFNSNMVTLPFINADKTLGDYKIFNDFIRERENIVKTINKKEDGFNGTYVLVIGESEGRTNMGVYGYEKNTTPWQTSLKNYSNAVIFENAYSCHTHTVQVLTYALTLKNQYENSKLNLNKTVSIVDMAKYAGQYNTAWISNQRKLGMYDTPISSIADTSDQQYWISDEPADPSSIVYDGELVKYIKKIKLSSDKNLIIIHLIGCHGAYINRYPLEFGAFTDEPVIVSAYNNSVYYNDHVLNLIYSEVKKIPNFKSMIYFSDHGEDANRNLGHDSRKFTWDMAKIPFWMVFSDSYIKEHPDKFKTLKEHRLSAFTNDMLFETLLGVLGITENEFYNQVNDLASESYNHSFSDLKTLHGHKSLSELSNPLGDYSLYSK